jgi:hypothetical protein
MTSDVLHSLFDSNYVIDPDSAPLIELTGLFAILGKELTKMQEFGFALSISKTRNIVTRVTTCDPLTRYVQTEDREAATTHLAKDSFIPSSRVCADPADFSLNNREIELICRIQQWALARIDSLNYKQVVFVAHFSGFLAIGLQISQPIFSDLSQFIGFALLRCGESLSMSELVNKIGNTISGIARVKASKTKEPLPYALSPGLPTSFRSIGVDSVVGDRIWTSLHLYRGLFCLDFQTVLLRTDCAWDLGCQIPYRFCQLRHVYGRVEYTAEPTFPVLWA